MSEIPDSQGLPATTISLHQDSADLQRQLIELEALRQRLAEKEALLRQAIEAGGLSAWHWDFRTQHFTMEAHLATPPTLFDNAPISEWEARIHPDDLPVFHARIPQMMRGDLPAHPQYRVRLSTDDYIWVEAHCDLIRDDQANIIGMTGVLINITRRKEAEQREMELAILQHRQAFLHDFLNMLTHDFKTPLVTLDVILNVMEHALKTQADPIRLMELMGKMKSQTAYMQNYVLGTLAFSQLEYAPQLTRQPVNLTKLLNDIVDQIRPLGEQKRLNFQLDTPATPPIEGDIANLSRAFLNLIENAVHYTPPDGRVTIRLLSETDQAVVEVQDTGIGIQPDEINSIFTQFFRAKAAREFSASGTGLGLAIAKKIIDMHSGTITVESTPNVGSLFRITLPHR